MGGQSIFFGWFIVFATALINAFGIGLFFTPMSQVHGFSQTGISSNIAFAMIGGMCAAAGLGSVYQRFGLRYVLFILGIGQAVILAPFISVIIADQGYGGCQASCRCAMKAKQR